MYPWDYDGDALPDSYEQAHIGDSPPLDYQNLLDGALDYDGDGISNAHEYWNGTSPWVADKDLSKEYAGCGFWGDSGLLGIADGIVSPADASEMQKVISGLGGKYAGVIPPNGETQDLDMDGAISPADFALIQNMIQGANIGVLFSRPTTLVVQDAPGAAVAVGSTCHVTVTVGNGSLNQTHNHTPGLGVVFEIDAVLSTGTATLLGGEGPRVADGTRYDVSGPIHQNSPSRIVLRIDSPGAIYLKARIPQCGMPGVGRSSPEIVLDPAAVIQGE
jgi:hypothetical protein